jgi:hypothetical protein
MTGLSIPISVTIPWFWLTRDTESIIVFAMEMNGAPMARGIFMASQPFSEIRTQNRVAICEAEKNIIRLWEAFSCREF